MAWIELHQSLPQHRKLLALRDALGLRTPAALGHMCLLWLWALDNAPDGDLSALPARQLAEICQFSERRAGDLAVALRTSGFVDADWRLHGFQVHAPLGGWFQVRLWQEVKPSGSSAGSGRAYIK